MLYTTLLIFKRARSTADNESIEFCFGTYGFFDENIENYGEYICHVHHHFSRFDLF